MIRTKSGTHTHNNINTTPKQPTARTLFCAQLLLGQAQRRDALRLPISPVPMDSQAGFFLLFSQPELEEEWLQTWTHGPLRTYECQGAIAQLVFSALGTILAVWAGSLSGPVVYRMFVETGVCLAVLLGPRIFKDEYYRFRTPLFGLLRLLYLPFLLWTQLVAGGGKILEAGRLGEAYSFLVFFFPLHLLMGTLRFPLRFHEHVKVQLGGAALGGGLAGMVCSSYFGSREAYRVVINSVRVLVALASTGVLVDCPEAASSSFGASCTTLSLQVGSGWMDGGQCVRSRWIRRLMKQGVG